LYASGRDLDHANSDVPTLKILKRHKNITLNNKQETKYMNLRGCQQMTSILFYFFAFFFNRKIKTKNKIIFDGLSPIKRFFTVISLTP
jgi:hypothetical protein